MGARARATDPDPTDRKRKRAEEKGSSGANEQSSHARPSSRTARARSLSRARLVRRAVDRVPRRPHRLPQLGLRPQPVPLGRIRRGVHRVLQVGRVQRGRLLHRPGAHLEPAHVAQHEPAVVVQPELQGPGGLHRLGVGGPVHGGEERPQRAEGVAAPPGCLGRLERRGRLGLGRHAGAPAPAVGALLGPPEAGRGRVHMLPHLLRRLGHVRHQLLRQARGTLGRDELEVA